MCEGCRVTRPLSPILQYPLLTNWCGTRRRQILQQGKERFGGCQVCCFQVKLQLHPADVSTIKKGCGGPHGARGQARCPDQQCRSAASRFCCSACSRFRGAARNECARSLSPQPASATTTLAEDFCFGSPRFITRELGGISLGIDLHSPTPEGMTFDAATGAPVRHAGRMRNYGQSRIANGLPDSELVRRYPPSPSKIVTNV